MNIMMKKVQRIVFVLISSLVVLTLSACGNDPFATQKPQEAQITRSAGNDIVVGASNFPESEIVANIYAQALIRAGMKAHVHANIGSRDIFIRALYDGSISLMPDYTGNLLQFYQPGARTSSSQEIIDDLHRVLPPQIHALQASSAQDKDVYVMLTKVAERYGIRTLYDLKKLPQPVHVAAPSELEVRGFGIPGLKNVYKLDVRHVVINDAGGPTTLQALNREEVPVVHFDSTSPFLDRSRMTILEDPARLVIDQNVIPLVAQQWDTPQLRAVINAVQKKLTTEDMQRMNYESVIEHKNARAIALEWIHKHLDTMNAKQ